MTHTFIFCDGRSEKISGVTAFGELMKGLYSALEGVRYGITFNSIENVDTLTLNIPENYPVQVETVIEKFFGKDEAWKLHTEAEAITKDEENDKEDFEGVDDIETDLMMLYKALSRGEEYSDESVNRVLDDAKQWAKYIEHMDNPDERQVKLMNFIWEMTEKIEYLIK